MSRWSLLKASLIEKKRDCSSSSSIHRFNGYNLIQKRKVPWRGFAIDFKETDGSLTLEHILSKCELLMQKVDAPECLARICALEGELLTDMLSHPSVRMDSVVSGGITQLYIKRKEVSSVSLPRCDYWSYSVRSATSTRPLSLFTRENPKDGGLSVQGLLSNKLHGVDNTGNVCVWPAEPLLLHTLLNVPRYTELVSGKRVVEIGGGMTALAGLGLAAAGLCESVVVTDGHPDCVLNQTVCIEMCSQQARDQGNLKQGNSPESVSLCREEGSRQEGLGVSSQLLHWSPSVNAAQVASLTAQGTRLFDIVVASDCLFFKDFHADLLSTLQQLLVPGGVGIFLQPSRDRTLQKFVDICVATGAFSAEIVEDYSPEVTALREQYLEKRDELGYVEEIHYPVMLLLTKNKSS